MSESPPFINLIDRLSRELMNRGGIANEVKKIYPQRNGMIWISSVRILIRISSSLELENPSQLFIESYSFKQQFSEDCSITLVIPAEKLEHDFEALVNLLVKYMFLRYKILQLMTGMIE